MHGSENLILKQGAHVHLIGVGGVGMSALAGVLAGRGYSVSGSDNTECATLDRLRKLGVSIHVPQIAGGAGDADLVVMSTAIPADNPELSDARERALPVYHRSELLAALIRGMQKVAVSGTHGKTTTTSMLATILLECGRDPLVVVGGEAGNLGSNYHPGSEPLAVFEADESDGTFLRYGPCSAIITNVESDHLDQHGDFETLCRAFESFIGLVPEDGFLAYSTDCPRLSELAPRAAGRLVTFGLDSDAQFQADRIEAHPFGVEFRLLQCGKPEGEARLMVPGRHNVANALGAIAAAQELGLSAAEALGSLESFRGVGRRFEKLGELDGALVVDDYAHHPTEVGATLKAARDSWSDRRLVAIFQPHLYSRTRDNIAQFARALSAADVVIVAGIYGAREDPIEGVDARDIANEIRALAPNVQVRYIAERREIAEAVRGIATADDLILTIGAGDIRKTGEELAGI